MKRETGAITELDIKLPKDHEANNHGGIWARFYWSQNAGMYGHQIVLEYNAGKGFKTYATNGCGYCKESAALEHFYIEVFGKYECFGGTVEYYSRGKKYHKGGNYFTMTLNQFKNLKK